MNGETHVGLPEAAPARGARALTPILPAGWPRPRGYSDGIAAPADARLVFVAGQIAWNEKHELVGDDDIEAQFEKALENVIAVVRAAGGVAGDIVSLTIYVTKKKRYLKARKKLGAAWRALMGEHYPAIALVEVKGLVERGALVEMQAVASVSAARASGKRRIADALRSSLDATKKDAAGGAKPA
jgi:enamine deaminase RidA (YjgF/YER057c/UK114 family)